MSKVLSITYFNLCSGVVAIYVIVLYACFTKNIDEQVLKGSRVLKCPVRYALMRIYLCRNFT
jgi:hypothetical protein